MSNTNLNNVAIDIIGVVTLFGLTQMYYNAAIVECKPLYKNSPAYLGYLGICSLSTFTALAKVFKYY